MSRNPYIYSIAHVERILRLVAADNSVTTDELRSDYRGKRLVNCRFLAMWLIRQETCASLVEIGKFFCRDHTSVRHGIMTIDRRIKDDARWQEITSTALAKLRDTEAKAA
jgi:chromosomal replication initiator protein